MYVEISASQTENMLRLSLSDSVIVAPDTVSFNTTYLVALPQGGETINRKIPRRDTWGDAEVWRRVIQFLRQAWSAGSDSGLRLPICWGWSYRL